MPRPVWRDDNVSAMYAMCIVRYRKPLEDVLKVQEAHRAYQRRLVDEGILLAAGPNAQYELLGWNVVIGKENLDRL